MPWMLAVDVTSASAQVEERDVSVDVPAGMHVAAMSLESAGARTDAVLMSAEAARDRFHDAVVRERDPALLEEQDGRAILRVFPVAADRPAHVRLELEPDEPPAGPYFASPLPRGVGASISLYAASPPPAHGRIPHVVIDPIGEPPRDTSLDAREIRRVVRWHEPELRHCYEVAAQREPSLAGRAELHFVIGADGAVAAATVDGTLRSEEVDACLARDALAWQFRAGGEAIVVNYPLRFEPPRSF